MQLHQKFIWHYWREQAKAFAKVIRLAPFDTTTVEGRSQERYRRLILTALAQAGSRGLLALTLLAAVPLTLSYLGQERYGLWATISSLLVLLQFADLGMGNGLLNAIAEANGRDDREAARRYISSAFFMLLSLSSLLAVVAVASYALVPWPKVLGVSSSPASAEAGPAIAVLLATFLISLPLGVVRRVQLGYQEGFASHLWDGVGNILGLGALAVAAWWQAPVPWLVLAVEGASIAALALNGWILFAVRYSGLRPDWRQVEWSAVLRIFRAGFLFFVIQLAAALAFNSDNLVISHMLGSQAVTQYAVPARLFSLITVVLNTALLPLWPAYGEAIARGDIRWVKNTLSRSVIVTLAVSAAGSVSLVLLGPSLLNIWTGGIVRPSLWLLIGFSAWVVAASLGSALSILLSGANIVRFQAVVALFTVTLVVLSKIILASYVGLAGVIWGTLIAYIVSALLPVGLRVRSLLQSRTEATT